MALSPHPPVNPDPSPGTDELFFRFAIGLFVVMVLYGLGMMIVVLFGDQTIASRMVSGFGTMFAGVLGLGSGYLLGRVKNSPEKEPGPARGE